MEIIIPDGSAVDVRGHVRKGSVQTDWPLEVEDNGSGGQTVKGRIGSGGATLAMEVTKGDLLLRRAPATEKDGDE